MDKSIKNLKPCCLLLVLMLNIQPLSFSQSKSNQQIAENQNMDSIMQIYSLHNVYFDVESVDIRETEIENLEHILALLNKYPDIVLEIKGHADKRENQRISSLRSKSVFDWFVEHDIAKSRLVYKGLGAVYPAFTEGNPESNQLNRRVEFSIVK
ncbi:MAG: OmpA family protein [Bacteroidales bacterium]|mgnify:CR=1 FL=1|nr:OmpA family protein [Bacteroidales bacterium]